MPAEPISPDYPFLNPDPLPPSPSLVDAVAFALQNYPGYKFLPSNYDSVDIPPPNTGPAAHFSCDDFRMYEFKVRRCMRGRSHDWTECPYAHPGEKARRRDPRRIHYSGAPCPDFRKGSCRRGDACEFAHGVFECWLHPARYRTQVCKDGKNCQRRVCFFAHSPEQLRILPASTACAPSSTHTLTDTADGSPVGSPRGALSQMRLSAEIPSSQMMFLSGSTGGAMLHPLQLSSPTATSSLPNTFTPHSSLQVSPISLHFDSLNGLPLRRAMARNFLACKGYGGGSFNLNVAPTEYSSVFDAYEGPTGGEMARASSCSSPIPSLQSRHTRNCNNECNFDLQEGGFSLDKSRYELSSHSHGFASPTSTLAAHTFSPPPLSPPLSPLSSPNIDKAKGTFTNPLHSFHVDDTVSYRNFNESNTNSMEDLAFRLQHLQIPESFNHVGPSPYEARHGMLDIAPLQSTHSRLPSPRHVSHGLSCTPKQSMWSPLSDFANSKDHGLAFLQAKDVSAHEMAAKMYAKIGEESTVDNLIPDVAWVSELVK